MASSEPFCIQIPNPCHTLRGVSLPGAECWAAGAGAREPARGWQTELEIGSFNTISQSPDQKDYDAIVNVWIGESKVRFALKFERTLKGLTHYERIRAARGQSRQSQEARAGSRERSGNCSLNYPIAY